jgi:hypothetical protein
MVRRLGVAFAALIALFHIWLFAGQVWDGELADPGRVVRWVLAGGVAGALAMLRRRGLPLWRSRPAIAIWLVAALLHAPAALPLPELATSATVAAAAVLVATVLGLVTAAPRRVAARVRLRGVGAGVAVAGPAWLGAVLLIAPRPPPRR